MCSRGVLVVGDLHLGPASPTGAGQALSALLPHYPAHELVLLGDTFDLSLDGPACVPAESVLVHLAEEPELTAALRSHRERGSPITLVCGNHDASLAQPEVHRALAELLSPRAAHHGGGVHIAPWFVRRHGYHLEHGHLWDPDNAPTHPLVTPTMDDEPLGVALTRFVIGPSRAFGFSHAHEVTPMRALLSAMRQMGPKAPLVVFRYYALALRLCLLAGERDVPAVVAVGEQKLARAAHAEGSDPDRLRAALALRPLPRHHDARDTFARLYLDRSLATAAVLAGLGLCALGIAPALGLGMAAVAGLYLGFSMGTRQSRYGHVLVHRMTSSARAVSSVLGGRGVVFSHTHVPYHRDRVTNVGSFGFPGPEGRPYVVIETDGELRSLRYPKTIDPAHPRSDEASAAAVRQSPPRREKQSQPA